MFQWDNSEVSLDSWVNLDSSHLICVDFTLQLGRGGEGLSSPMRANQPVTCCCLLAVYAPRDGMRLWRRVHDFLGNTEHTVLLTGDFNNRVQPEDRMARCEPPSRPSKGLPGKEESRAQGARGSSLPP